MNPFDDRHAVANYADGPPRLVPGFADMQRMSHILLAENAPDDARMLVVGAGGGLELKVFAERRPHWRFVGVDPASAMLDLARDNLGPLAQRVTFHEGYIATAPAGPFDGATCLLTLHFIAPPDRAATLRQIRARLKPGAPLVAVHFSIPGPPEDRGPWLSRYVAFAKDSGLDPARVDKAAQAIGALPILSPEKDEAMLSDAGFSDVQTFYAGLTFRGWIAYA